MWCGITPAPAAIRRCVSYVLGGIAGGICCCSVAAAVAVAAAASVYQEQLRVRYHYTAAAALAAVGAAVGIAVAVVLPIAEHSAGHICGPELEPGQARIPATEAATQPAAVHVDTEGSVAAQQTR
ncbi:hypothetical protein BASA81_009260 [Batrachochytrium salamandrivorans]|nr:hypothetical protein BASA81_009260 [Batrachochytrium salamandrivorans]